MLLERGMCRKCCEVGSKGGINLISAPSSLGGRYSRCRPFAPFGDLIGTSLVEFIAETWYSYLGFVT